MTKERRSAPRNVRVLVAIVSSTVTAITIVACLDPSPYTMPPASNDAALPPLDAATDGDGALVTTCTACLQAPNTPGPGCADELTACKASTECAAALACALAKSCFDRGSLETLVACGLPCAKEAGIVSNDDPALAQAYDLFQCAGTTCGAICHLSGGVDASFLD